MKTILDRVYAMRRYIFQAGRILVGLFFCAACWPVQKKPVMPVVPITGTPTPVMVNVGEDHVIREQPDEAPVDAAILTPDPLRFVFPTPGPVPMSAWRPPLYPVPWAPTSYDHFFFTRPIEADQVNWPLADYRYGGVFLEDVVHTGVDIPAPRGTRVLATGPGRVIWAGYGLYSNTDNPKDPYGLAVSIKHDFGYDGETLFTIYGHMESIDVFKGQYLNTGDLIGRVGDTGKTTGVHLHFEVRVGQDSFYESRNPELWMTPPQGWGILAARVMDEFGELLPGQLIRLRSWDTGQYWEVKTYGRGATNSDPYYRENVVIGDLPAGRLHVWVPMADITLDTDIFIRPGRVTFFKFKGRNGFDTTPPLPLETFEPPVTNTPAPRLP